MPKKNILRHFLAVIIFVANTSYADSGPWYTGPIIAPSGVTIPNGHTNVEVYSIFVHNHGIYDRHSKLTPTPTAKSTQLSGIFSHGLSDSVDMQFTFPVSVNHFQRRMYQGVGDMQALLGYQVYAASKGSWWPNFRVTIQETIPTGRYDHLRASLLGADANGLGSYKTTLNLNFQSLIHVFSENYLRVRLALHATERAPTQIIGLSQYGGASDTFGRIKPGATHGIDLAGEFNLTQNWVLVMEGYYVDGQATHFSGFPGLTTLGHLAKIGHGPFDELTLAPAVEYNFSANVGIIAGIWYSVQGTNAAKLFSPTIALNAYW